MLDVTSLSYKPGWSFKIGGPLGSMLCVHAETVDSQHHSRTRRTQHMFTIPADLDDRQMIRWVFDQLLLCELHETCEFFTVDGVAPFFPNHQDEGSPYDLVDRMEIP
jgi:hypothetical protein